MATSYEDTERYFVTGVAPPPGETAVPIEITPTVVVEITHPDADPVVSLFDDQSQEVPGDVDVADDAAVFTYRFVPHRPLERDRNYTLVISDELAFERVEYLQSNGGYDPSRESGKTSRLEISFFTGSDPRVRYARGYPNSGAYVSFSQAMDLDTLTAETVSVVVDGELRIPSRVAPESPQSHEVSIGVGLSTSTSTSATLLLEPGIAAADGTPMADLPQAVEFEFR